MRFDDFKRVILSVAPNATFDRDENGRIVISTNLVLEENESCDRGSREVVSDMQVVVEHGPDGTLYGPFKDEEAAEEWGNKNIGNDSRGWGTKQVHLARLPPDSDLYTS